MADALDGEPPPAPPAAPMTEKKRWQALRDSTAPHVPFAVDSPEFCFIAELVRYAYKLPSTKGPALRRVQTVWVGFGSLNSGLLYTKDRAIHARVDDVDYSFSYQEAAAGREAFRRGKYSEGRKAYTERKLEERAQDLIAPGKREFKALSDMKCEVCQKALAPHQADVDHKGTWSFNRLWTAFKSVHPDVMLVRANDDDSKRWVEYHNANCKYQIACKECHYAKSGNETKARCVLKRAQEGVAAPAAKRRRQASSSKLSELKTVHEQLGMTPCGHPNKTNISQYLAVAPEMTSAQIYGMFSRCACKTGAAK